MSSVTLIYFDSVLLFNNNMKTIEETRLDKLLILRDELGSTKALAELLGKSSSQISQWLNQSPDSKTGKPRAINNASAREIEQLARKPKGWMDQNDNSIRQGAEPYLTQEIEPAPNLPPFKAVPIVGTVQGGDNGYFSNLDYPPGYGDDSIYFPTKNHDTYALRVRGDSMSPRIKDGEHVIIDPHPEISPGDEVIVCLKNEKKMVKQFLFKKEGRYTFGSINEDHKNITESEENIESIDRVIAIIPKASFYNT